MDAARKLAKVLPSVDRDNTVVIALPRGGVPMGAVLAQTLGVPLDVLIVRKIGAPRQRELAVGAVTDWNGLQVTINGDIARSLGLSNTDIRRLAESEQPELKRRAELYRADRSAIEIANKTVILVDDGIATGATVRSALRLLKSLRAAKIVLAVGVAPVETLRSLASEADEIVCLASPEPFFAVGSHYREFEQVTDDEVVEILSRYRSGEEAG